MPAKWAAKARPTAPKQKRVWRSSTSGDDALRTLPFKPCPDTCNDALRTMPFIEELCTKGLSDDEDAMSTSAGSCDLGHIAEHADNHTPADRRCLRGELQRKRQGIQIEQIQPEDQVEVVHEEAEARIQALQQMEARLNAKQVALDKQQRVLSILAQRQPIPSGQQEQVQASLLSPRPPSPGSAAELSAVYEFDWAGFQSPQELTPGEVQHREEKS